MPAPVSTGAIGIDQNGVISEYVPPVVNRVPQTSVTYGEPETLAEGDPLPAGYWTVTAGSVEAVGGAATIQQIIVATAASAAAPASAPAMRAAPAAQDPSPPRAAENKPGDEPHREQHRHRRGQHR